jgi:MFS transporter, DHA1 family, inner membrane transport protein
MITRHTMFGAIYAGVAALFIVNVLPALVNVLALGLAWDERALGLFASADVAGITLGSLAGIPLVKRLSLRRIILWNLAILVMADIGCSLVGREGLVVVSRLVGGVAAGLILDGCYAVFSYGNAQKSFAGFIIGQMVSAFLGVTVLPVLNAHFGWRSSFYLLAGLSALAIPLGVALPDAPYVKEDPNTAVTGARTPLLVWAAVAGIVIYLIGAGAIWTFMGRMGTDSGLSEHDVNLGVSMCTFIGILGAAASLGVGKRGVVRPLVISALATVLAVCFMRTNSAVTYMAALSVFTFAWMIFATLQFAVITAADPVGTATIGMSAAWYAGFAIGPYLAGSLFALYGFRPVLYMGVFGSLVALVSVLPLCTRRLAPAPA